MVHDDTCLSDLFISQREMWAIGVQGCLRGMVKN